MNGRDFLTVARDVVRGPTEAHWRTAAARAYYAVMIELRDAMTKWGLSQPPHASVHDVVRRRVFASTDSDMKQIGIALDELRKRRSRADYETASPAEFASDAKALDMIRIGAQALTRFDGIEADLQRRSAIAAEIKRIIP